MAKRKSSSISLKKHHKVIKEATQKARERAIYKQQIKELERQRKAHIRAEQNRLHKQKVEELKRQKEVYQSQVRAIKAKEKAEKKAKKQKHLLPKGKLKGHGKLKAWYNL